MDCIEWGFELPAAGIYRVDMNAIVEQKALSLTSLPTGSGHPMALNGLPFVEGQSRRANADLHLHRQDHRRKGKSGNSKVALPAGNNKLKIALKDAAGPRHRPPSVTLVKCRQL